MGEIDYRNLRVLVADDFSNFRSTVSGMLTRLGVYDVATVSNGAEVIETCKQQGFDVILCDYDLGSGKNGQQVLEELRHRQIINSQTLFIIVSADAAKDVVMAAYDCAPDDYLMKPITAQVLQLRMNRLLHQRQALLPAYRALDASNTHTATNLLVDMSLAQGRHSIAAQKLLGELFLQQNDLNKAEKLYSRVLSTRQVDWARLGLARVKQARGDLETAGQWLEQIVEENPLYLPAYDALAYTYEQMGLPRSTQQAVQKSVNISPKSILRQKRLAQAAEFNGDHKTAIGALRSTVKLGEQSCHARPDDCFDFARLATDCVERKLEPPTLSSEAAKVLQNARERFTLDKDQLLRAQFLEGRAHTLAGNKDRGRLIVRSLEQQGTSGESVDTRIAQVCALRAIGEAARADELLNALLDEFAGDQAALEKLDALLTEPVSESNRTLVANINREGIDLYNHARFDEAMESFARARAMFPRNVGIVLNIVQTLIGKTKADPSDELSRSRIGEILSEAQNLIDESHAQYQRFIRLRDMAQPVLDASA